MGYKLYVYTTFYALVLTWKPYMKKGDLITCTVYTLSYYETCECHLTLDYCKNVVESVSHSGWNSSQKP